MLVPPAAHTAGAEPLRRRMIALGSDSPTRAIRSALIAEAFKQLGCPILSDIEELPAEDDDGAVPATARATRRGPSTSRCFQVANPTIDAGFDRHAVTWRTAAAAE